MSLNMATEMNSGTEMLCECCEKNTVLANVRYCEECKDVPESHPAKFKYRPKLQADTSTFIVVYPKRYAFRGFN